MANAHDLLMAQRAAMMGCKPLPYLRRVAYLESHGTEWINTKLQMKGRFGFEIDFEPTALLFNRVVIGSASGDWEDDLSITANESDISFTWWNNNNEIIAASFQLGRSKVSAGLHGGLDISINGVSLFRMGRSKAVYGTEIYLFAYNELEPVGEVTWKSSSRIYSFKYGIIGDYPNYDATIIADMIPVLDLAGRPALYDEMRNELFYNQGTGEFTWGELDEA